MPQQRKPNDLSRSLIALDMDTTLIAVVELSLSSWLVVGIVPGVERQPLKKLKTDENALLALLMSARRDFTRRGSPRPRRCAVTDNAWKLVWMALAIILADVVRTGTIASTASAS